MSYDYAPDERLAILSIIFGVIGAVLGAVTLILASCS